MYTITLKHLSSGKEKTFTWKDDIKVWLMSVAPDSHDLYGQELRVIRTGWVDDPTPKPIIGQEAICPDGLGRVIDIDDFGSGWITVATYVKNNESKWARHNIELIDPHHGGNR